jgi:hypothetical protein
LFRRSPEHLRPDHLSETAVGALHQGRHTKVGVALRPDRCVVPGEIGQFEVEKIAHRREQFVAVLKTWAFSMNTVRPTLLAVASTPGFGKTAFIWTLAARGLVAGEKADGGRCVRPEAELGTALQEATIP